jgi:hypothetical protein
VVAQAHPQHIADRVAQGRADLVHAQPVDEEVDLGVVPHAPLPGAQRQLHGLPARVAEQVEQPPDRRDHLGRRCVVRRGVEQALNRGAVGRDAGERLGDQPRPRLGEELTGARVVARGPGVRVGALALQPGDLRVVERKT